MPGVFSSDGMVSEVKKLIDAGFQRSVWHSLTAMPKNVCFEAQHEDEQVILFMRGHWSTNLHWIGLILVLFFIPFFWGEFPLISNVSPITGLALGVCWYTALAFMAIEELIIWFYNVYIVTNERIIDVDFYGLLYKTVKTAQISRIEDVSYSQKGLMSSFFDYGNVTIQTASEQIMDKNGIGSAAFDFVAVTNPNEVVKVVSELIEKEEDKHGIR